MTIKEIANIIADGLNRPVDGLLINRLKELIILQYNDLISEQIQKYRYDNLFRTKYIVDSFTTVDIAEDNTFSIGTKLLKTTNKIPKPIRLKDRPSPFYYVGAIDYENAFVYTEPYAISKSRELPMMNKSISYFYKDEYIYIYNNLLVERILIDCAFENLLINPTDSNNTGTGIYFTQDMELPVPNDIIAKIIELLPKRYLNQIDFKDKVEGGHLDNN